MDKNTEQRWEWVDYAKGFGIILVVYGHLLSSAYHGGIQVPQHFFALSDSIVYSFHMPLFFFLAGLFAESSLQKRGTRAYVIDKFARLAYPYFVWSILQVSVEVIFSNQTQLGATVKDVLAVPYQPWGQFWFLYALFLMYMVHVVLSKFGRFSTLLMAALGLAFFFYPVMTSQFALPGFSVHFIFFVGGIWFRKHLENPVEWTSMPSVAIGLLLLFIASAFYVFEYAIEPVRLAGSLHPLYFLFLSTLGIAAFTVLSMYLARISKLQIFRILGKYSLPIYLVHMLAGVGLRMVLLNLFHIQNWIVHILAGVSFALLAPIVLQIAATRINFHYMFELRKRPANSPNRISGEKAIAE